MRRVKFSLFSKTLLWVFLNLLVLGGILLFIFNLDFRFAPRSPFFRESANRIGAVSRLISLELSGASREERDQTLAKYGEAYNIAFYVFDEKGGQLAGKQEHLPDEVVSALNNVESQKPPMPPDFNEGDKNLPPPPMMMPPGRPPFFFVKTDNPTLYWSGSPLMIYDKNSREPQTAILLTASDSFSGQGLYFDPKPWIIIVGVIVLVSILLWLPFVRGITKNIRQITTVTEQIAEEKFDVRVSEKRSDELGRLGSAINLMSEKLSGFVYGQKRFLGDISHELNSPLARLQLSLSVLEDFSDAKTQRYIDGAKEEVQLMTKLVGELLTFSKAGIKGSDVLLEKIILRPLVDHVVRRENAENKAEFEIKVDENLQVSAHREMLTRAISNIVRNAIRYAGNAGKIEIAARQENERVILTVADCGAGVPENQIVKLFDPFYRIETHRSRETGGSGLGLAIVKTCIEACHGKVSARNRQPHGLEVKISLQKSEA